MQAQKITKKHNNLEIRSGIRRGRLAEIKGSVQCDFLSWRYDLAKLNPKCH